MPNSKRIITHGNWEYGFILTQLVEMLENLGNNRFGKGKRMCFHGVSIERLDCLC